MWMGISKKGKELARSTGRKQSHRWLSEELGGRYDDETILYLLLQMDAERLDELLPVKDHETRDRGSTGYSSS